MESNLIIPMSPTLTLDYTLTFDQNLSLIGTTGRFEVEKGRSSFSITQKSSTEAYYKETISQSFSLHTQTSPGYKDAYYVSGTFDKIKVPFFATAVTTYTDGTKSNSMITGSFSKPMVNTCKNKKMLIESLNVLF